MSEAEKPKPRRGRPPLPAGRAKSTVVMLRMTAEDHALVEAAAVAAGVSITEWARDAMVDAAKAAPSVTSDGALRQPK